MNYANHAEIVQLSQTDRLERRCCCFSSTWYMRRMALVVVGRLITRTHSCNLIPARSYLESRTVPWDSIREERSGQKSICIFKIPQLRLLCALVLGYDVVFQVHPRPGSIIWRSNIGHGLRKPHSCCLRLPLIFRGFFFRSKSWAWALCFLFDTCALACS